jgi:H+/Cl- antiporter ClcA
MADATTPSPDPAAIMRTRQFVVLLVLAAIVGVVAAFASWIFLEAVNEAQDGVWTDLPDALGFDHTPLWWGLPVLALAGVVVAFAIARLPGNGGHIPAEGLNAGPTQPIDLPGVTLAAVAGIGLGAVVGPEAPLIALGGGLGYFAIRRLRADAPVELQTLVAACGTFAAVSFLFGSPLIAAVILIEAAGIAGRRLPLVLIPGLLAAGIGTLVEVGLGSWTGVNTSAISLQLLQLPDFVRPDIVDFLWTVPLAAAIALGTVVIFRIGRATERIASPRPFTALPLIGLAVAGLAIAFAETTDKGVDQVLFSGQDALGPLTANAGTWSLSALALLLVFKGIAYGLSVGSFRGGPTFPAMFLGAAAGVMASHLAGFDLTPAVAVGIGAGTVAVLRLPLSAVVLATVLTGQSGLGAGPLIIVGVVVAYLVANLIDPRPEEAQPEPMPAQ